MSRRVERENLIKSSFIETEWISVKLVSVPEA